MQDGQEIVMKLLRGLEFESDASESKIENLCAARRRFAEYGISVCSGHGYAFRLALDGVVRAGLNAGTGDWHDNLHGCSGSRDCGSK